MAVWDIRRCPSAVCLPEELFPSMARRTYWLHKMWIKTYGREQSSVDCFILKTKAFQCCAVLLSFQELVLQFIVFFCVLVTMWQCLKQNPQVKCPVLSWQSDTLKVVTDTEVVPCWRQPSYYYMKVAVSLTDSFSFIVIRLEQQLFSRDLIA